MHQSGRSIEAGDIEAMKASKQRGHRSSGSIEAVEMLKRWGY
jgi:hypothetical protein